MDLRYSELAAGQIAEIRAKGEAHPRTAHAMFWDALRRVLELVLADKGHALAARTQLGNKAQDFRGIRRIKFGGRSRLIYIASSAKQAVIVLFIGYRKEGDKNDVYAELSRRLHGDEFDTLFGELGIKKPKG